MRFNSRLDLFHLGLESRSFWFRVNEPRAESLNQRGNFLLGEFHLGWNFEDDLLGV